MYSYWPPHMAGQKQNDLLEHTYSSDVRIRVVALKTCQRRWTMGRSGEWGSEIVTVRTVLIRSSSRTWSTVLEYMVLGLAHFATRPKFLHPSGYGTVINCVVTFNQVSLLGPLNTPIASLKWGKTPPMILQDRIWNDMMVSLPSLWSEEWDLSIQWHSSQVHPDLEL